MKGIKKMLVLKKSSIITICLISILVVAGYLNFMNTPKTINESVIVSTEGEEKNYEEEPKTYGEAKFVDSSNVSDKSLGELRYERDKKKSEILAVYKQIMENAKSTEEQISEATASVLKLAKDTDMETNMESLLSAKKFENPAVIISNDGVSVFVDKEELTKTDIAVIRDVVIGETNLTSDRIRISGN